VFSGEVDIGSREEDASKQKSGASVLIQSELTLQARCDIDMGRRAIFGWPGGGGRPDAPQHQGNAFERLHPP
jgi:hypothetical protein